MNASNRREKGKGSFKLTWIFRHGVSSGEHASFINYFAKGAREQAESWPFVSLNSLSLSRGVQINAQGGEGD
jgi:hypothetical protein